MTSGGDVNWVGWGRDYISGNESINDGKWHHVVVVWDYSGTGTTGTGKMYVDGTDATELAAIMPTVMILIRTSFILVKITFGDRYLF
jgi:hypothetical protein